MTYLGIGAAARAAGVSVTTIRNYERAGLIRPASRLACGYRRYPMGQLPAIAAAVRAELRQRTGRHGQR